VIVVTVIATERENEISIVLTVADAKNR